MGETAQKRWKLIASIALVFAKIGPMTFGGGYAMIPLIEREIIVRRKWLKVEEVTDAFAVSQSLPGAVAINSAMFIGYRLAGVTGAVAAMTGVLLPTVLIVLALSIAFAEFRTLPLISSAFEGIRPAIVAIICYAGYRIGKTAIVDRTTLAIMLVTFGLLFFANIHPVLIIVFGFFLGMAIVAIRSWRGLKTKLDDQPVEEDEWGGFMFGDGI